MGRNIEWAMWANEQAVISCAILFVGGILSVSSKGLKDFEVHEFWGIGAYGIFISLLIFFLEYPRGNRKKGRTLQRYKQHVVTPIVAVLPGFGKHYFVRFAFYILASAPCLINLGTVMGGTALLVTGIIYLRAALAGEHWTPCEKVVNREKTITRNRPPSMAPPRLNPSEKYVNEGAEDEIYENAANAKV